MKSVMIVLPLILTEEENPCERLLLLLLLSLFDNNENGVETELSEVGLRGALNVSILFYFLIKFRKK